MEKTVKLHAYPAAKEEAMQGKPVDEQTLELAMKDAQIEEERSRSLEHLKTIVQLREAIKQEQLRFTEMAKKTADMESKVNELVAAEAGEAAKKNTQLEEHKQRALEQGKAIEQLRESIKQEQEKNNVLAAKTSELEAMIKTLSDTLEKISELAAKATTS
jgi:hypothetical protein